jgi:YjbE family integral membrane protein
MLGMLSSAQFWVDVLKIIVIDVLLSGDNAVVIALACRSLPAERRKQGVRLGMAGAITLRMLLTFSAAGLLMLPYLKVAGALMLLWIGVKLILPDERHGAGAPAKDVKANIHLWGAVRTIIVADFIMSLDNVLGVAAAAHGNAMLMAFGLLVSIPLVAWSSQLVLRLIDRFHLVIYGGGALLGYVAGEMLVSDANVASALEGLPEALQRLAPAVCAVLVVAAGLWLAARRASALPEVNVVEEQVPAANDKQS